MKTGNPLRANRGAVRQYKLGMSDPHWCMIRATLKKPDNSLISNAFAILSKTQRGT
jgi:hypothetical protein